MRIIELLKITINMNKSKNFSLDELYYWVMQKLFKNFNITKDTLLKRLRTLFTRYLSKFNRPPILYYLSCKNAEDKIFNNIVGTYKELFCNICLVYNCNSHGPGDKLFDSKYSYDLMSYAQTFVNMIELPTPSKENCFTKYDEILISQIEEYQLFIEKYKMEKVLKKINYNNAQSHCKDSCSFFCFKDFMFLKGEKKSNVIKNCLESSNKEIENNFILNLYLEKLFRIFNYNPCILSKFLSIIFDKNTECTKIYMYLISNPVYNIKDVLVQKFKYYKLLNKQEVINKKNLKLNKIGKKQEENIVEQIDNSNLIIY
jgi:hypothetical protein